MDDAFGDESQYREDATIRRSPSARQSCQTDLRSNRKYEQDASSKCLLRNQYVNSGYLPIDRWSLRQATSRPCAAIILQCMFRRLPTVLLHLRSN
jgi:hypothetical protein